MLLEREVNAQTFALADSEVQLSAAGILEGEHWGGGTTGGRLLLLLEDADDLYLNFIAAGRHDGPPLMGGAGSLRFLAQLPLNPLQELGVRGGLAEAGEKQFRRLGDVERIQHSA